MCVSYAPLCCRHCQPPPPSHLTLGLGGGSLSRERSHLMRGRLILGLAAVRITGRAFNCLEYPVVGCNVYLPKYQVFKQLSDLNDQILALTCEHAFIDDTGAADQHGVTWHNGPIAGDDHHITGHQISRQSLFDFFQEVGYNGVVEKVNVCI